MSRDKVFLEESADDSPGFLLYRVTVLWQEMLKEIFDGFGINQTRYAILASLKYFEEKGEGVTQAHLVEHTAIEKMTLSKSVRTLEVGGLVLRTPSPTDSRAVTVRLTPKGRKLVEGAIREVERRDEEFFQYLSPEQRSRFKEIALALIRGNAASF